MKIRFTQYSKGCLQDIYENYKDKGASKYGRTIRSKIILKSLKLKEFPSLGRIEENLENMGFGHRFLVEGDYKIIYKIVGSEIIITDIFDTRQDPDKMLPR